MSASPSAQPSAEASTYSYEYKGPGSVSPQRSVADLQAELTAAREELVANIAALKAEVNPAAIVSRAGQGVLNYFRTPEGGINVKRAAIAGGIVAGVITLKILTRRR